MELSVDGKRVFAATGGRPFDPALPAVVFLHGAGMDHTVWQLQTRYFAYHGRSVLALDLPGHGRSEGPALPTVAALGDWLEALVGSAGVGDVSLVGHSLGTFVAMEGALRLGDSVRAIALCATAARMPVHPDLLAAARAGADLAHRLVVGWGFDPAAHFGGHKAPGYWMIGGGLRLLQRDTVAALGVDLAAAEAYDGAVAAVGRIAAPITFVLGAHDRMTPPKNARPLIEAAAKADNVVIPGCGHMMMIERPDQTLDALRRALGKP